MRGVRTCVSGGAHKGDYLAARHVHAFAEIRRIAIKMRVIVAEFAGLVEQVNCICQRKMIMSYLRKVEMSY